MADFAVRKKCIRCKMRASASGETRCKLCNDELTHMASVDQFDHYFWGLTASRNESIYYVRIYHDCDNLEWLKDKRIKVDLEDANFHGVVSGIVANAESMQKPPYERGDVVTVTLKEN